MSWTDIFLIENEEARSKLAQQVQMYVSDIRIWKIAMPDIEEIIAVDGVSADTDEGEEYAEEY